MSVYTHHVDLVCLQKHYAQRGAPLKSPQHNSRSQISVNSGSLQLDAEPEGISENERENGPLGSGPVCFSPDQATATILQLKSRSRSSSDRHLHAGLVTTLGLCQSTLVPDPPVSLQGKNTVSVSSVDNSLVENPVMVSNSAGAPGGLPCNSTNPARSSSDPSKAGVSDETESAPN